MQPPILKKWAIALGTPNLNCYNPRLTAAAWVIAAARRNSDAIAVLLLTHSAIQAQATQ